MAFDIESAIRARQANPDLTVFDTGELLEPHPAADQRGKKTGAVDFDDDESTTHLTVFAHPSGIEDGLLVLNIDSALVHRLAIVVNDGTIGTIDKNGNWFPAASDGSQHYIDTGLPLATRPQ